MYHYTNIIFVLIAILINAIVFGYVASNTKDNQTNKSYLLFLSFIILYTIFDCIIIQAFDFIETKNIIVKIQALFWMPLSALFLNFVYFFIRKERDEIFYLLIISTITSTFFTLFSDKVLLGFKDYNFGTMAFTGPWFLPVTFMGVLPAAGYAIFLIGKEGKVYMVRRNKKEKEDFSLLQLKILFYGSFVCLLIAVSTNIFFDKVFGYSGELHLASLSLSIQSIFLLPALIKYNFLNKPIEQLGEELYAKSSDAVLIINTHGTIINQNKSARKLLKVKEKFIKNNIENYFNTEYNYLINNDNYETKTKQGREVSITQSDIEKDNHIIGKILVIRDISQRKKAEKAYKHAIESSSDIIYNTNISGVVTYVNPVFEKIFGYKKEELIGVDINLLVVPDYQKKIKDIYYEFIKSKKDNITTEMPCKKKNGSIIWLELNTSKRKSGNKILEFSTISRDITERKKTEFKLQESEDRYRQLVENSTDMIYKTDKYGNYTYVNQVFIKNSGETEAKILKTNCFERVEENYREKVKTFYRKQLETKELITLYEFPCYIANNKIIWVSQVCHLELDEAGNPNGHSVTARDITEKKQAEKQLIQKTKELKLAQSVAGLGSFSYDIKKDIITWSDELYKIYGRDQKSFSPTKESFFNKIVHQDSRKMVIDKVDEAINNKLTEFDYVHKTQMTNGTEKWFQAIIKIQYNKKNEAIIMNGTSQDITELYSIRHDLEKSELRLQKAQEIAKLGTWEENHKTGEIYWSSILKNLFELKKNKIINTGDFWKKVHPKDLKWMKKNWESAEKNKTPYSGTFRIMLKNGKLKHLMEQAEFIVDTKGKLLKTIGTVIDMTELHEYQEELRQLSSHIQTAQEEERAHIAREVHDELGQRLTSITMDLAFLSSKIKNNTPIEIKERLKALENQAEGTIQIIRKISQELRPSILDDLGLISALDWLKEQYNRRTSIHFSLDMPEKEVNITGEYATAIFRITQEALTNIIRHSKAKNVDIKMKLINSKIVLSIKDDGVGFINNNNKITNIKTFGIFGMKERANNLGGNFIINNNIGRGTIVKLTLPYTQKKKMAI